MIRRLFKRVISLISSPAKAWEEIGKEEDRRKVLGAFVYPMIGLCGLSVFIGTFIGNKRIKKRILLLGESKK